MENSKRFDKEQVEPINPSFAILDNRSKSLEFLYGSLPLTPHRIGISQEVTLISSTMHAMFLPSLLCWFTP